MAKKMYFGVAGKARKVKKMYFGAGGKARKVKKGYIGIGGKARPFFSGGELAYYGTATALSVARNKLAATAVGNYALFGGGVYVSSGGVRSAVVDAYNASLTRSTPTDLSTPRYHLAATSIGDYALFGGGYDGKLSAVVDAYIVA